jgi:RimJ/RimL family protein N-acetyltransferase
MDPWLRGHPPETMPAGSAWLRRWRLDDVPALVEAVTASFDHLRPWMAWAQQMPTTDGMQAFVAGCDNSWASGREFTYAAVSLEGSDVLGSCGLWPHPVAGAMEIGYWIDRRQVRRGHATAAVRSLTAAAFTLPEVARVEIHCDEANAGSAGVARSAGYRLERIRPREIRAPAETGREMVWVAERRT